MIQFYFLSIFFNIVAGSALCAESGNRHSAAIDGLRAFLRDRTVRLVLGILSVAVGCLKLVTTIRGDIPIVGDFVPACAGIAVGLTLLLELYRAGEAASSAEPASSEGPEAAATASARFSKLERILLSNKVSIGIAAAIAGVVHFLFPTVLFL
jgi:hypothetical protein